MYGIFSFVFIICVFFTIEAHAATRQAVLRWCTPTAGTFQNGPPGNFEWISGESAVVKAEIEKVLSDKSNRKIRQARAIVRTKLGTILGKGTFKLSGVIDNKNLADTTCEDPSETNSQVGFEVTVYDRVFLLVGNVENTAATQRELGLAKADALLTPFGSIVVKTGESLGEIAAGDTRFRNFLGLSERDLDVWGGNMIYVLRYDGGILDNPGFQEAGIAAPKVAVEDSLERIAQMVLGQIASLGIVPGSSLTPADIEKIIESGLPEYVKPLTGGRVGAEVTQNGDLLITYALDGPLLTTELRSDNLSETKTQMLNNRFVRQTEGDWDPEDRLATHRYVFPTKYDELRDELYLESQENINVAVPSVSNDVAIFGLIGEPENSSSSIRVPIDLGYSTQNELRISVGVELKDTIAASDIEALSFALIYEDSHLSGEGLVAWRLADSWAGGKGDGVILNLRAISNTIDARYGFQADLDLTETRNIVEVSLSGGHDSMSQAQFQRATNPYLPSLGQNRWYGFHDVGLRYQDVSISGQSASLLSFGGGEALGPFAEGSLNFSTFSPFSLSGAGNTDFVLSYEMFWGVGLGNTDRFLRGIGDAAVRFAFDLPGERSGYLRLRGFAGAVDSDAPEYAFIDASSPKFFEGFDTQEIMGRSVYGLVGELGIDLSGLLRRMSKSQSREASERHADQALDDSGVKQEPNPLLASIQPRQSFYLAGFASFGSVRDRLVAGVQQSSSEALQSYGAKIVMRQVTGDGRSVDLEFGYAYSPQSVVHTSGVVFVGLSSAF